MHDRLGVEFEFVSDPLSALRLGEQDAAGHELDVGARADLVGKADLVADRAAEFSPQLLRDARRGCVWPMNPAMPRPSSSRIFGSCVVLPEPVSPQTMTT